MTAIDEIPSRRRALGVLGALVLTGTGSLRLHAQAVAPDEAKAEASPIDRWICALAVSHDGRLLAAASTSRKIAVWEITTGNLVQAFAIPDTQNTVGALAFDEGNEMLLVGNAPQRRRSKGKSILMFDIKSGDNIGGVSADPDWVSRFATSEKAAFIATIGLGNDRSVRLWAKDGMRIERLWPAHDATVQAVAVSPDGRMVATGGSSWRRTGRDPSIKIWDASSGRLLHRMGGHANGPKCLAFTADGRRLVSLAADAVNTWATNTGKLVTSLKLSDESVNEMLVAPDASWFAMVSHQPDAATSTFAIRAAATGMVRHSWSRAAQTDNPLVISPDGTMLFAGGDGGLISSWDVKAGAPGREFRLDENAMPVR